MDVDDSFIFSMTPHIEIIRYGCTQFLRVSLSLSHLKWEKHSTADDGDDVSRFLLRRRRSLGRVYFEILVFFLRLFPELSAEDKMLLLLQTDRQTVENSCRAAVHRHRTQHVINKCTFDCFMMFESRMDSPLYLFKKKQKQNKLATPLIP